MNGLSQTHLKSSQIVFHQETKGCQDTGKHIQKS